MKTLVCMIGFLVVLLSKEGFAEMSRRTASDLYQESYQAQMERISGMSAAEMRAGEYRKIYESCDLNHNCTNATAGNFQEQKNNFAASFTYPHMWQ